MHIWTLYAYIHANMHIYGVLDTYLTLSSLQLNSISSIYMQRLHTTSMMLSLDLILESTLPSLMSPCLLNTFSKTLEEKILTRQPSVWFPAKYLHRQVSFMNNVRDLIWLSIPLPHSVFPIFLAISLQHRRANPASVRGEMEPNSSQSSKSRF